MDIPHGRTWLLDGALPEQMPLAEQQEAFLAAGADTLRLPAGLVPETDEQLEQYRLLLADARKRAGDRPIGGRLRSAETPENIRDLSFAERVRLYTNQADDLRRAGVDYYFVESDSSLTDIRASVLACRRMGLPVLAGVSVNDEGITPSGTTALTCLIVLQELGISAFGVESDRSPEQMRPLFEELASFAKVPLGAKPAACRAADDETPARALTPEEFAEEYTALFRCGVTVAGGCAGVTPDYFEALRKAMDRFDFDTVNVEKNTRELILTSVHETFCYDLDMLEFSPTVHPLGDLTDEFVEIEDETSYDIISVQVDTLDDAFAFAENDHMAELPVSFLSSNALALSTALLLYSGRAMVDARSELEPEKLQQIADKYGAVVY